MTDTSTPTIVLFGNPNPQMTHEVTEQLPDGSTHVVARVQRPAEHLSQSTTRLELRPEVLDPAHVELTLLTENDRQLSRLAQVVPDDDRLYVLMLHETESILDVHAGGAKPTWVRSSDSALGDALARHFSCPNLGAPGDANVDPSNPDFGSLPTALRTNAGRDLLLQQQLFTSQPAAANFGALSANSGAGFAATDTTLAGEIATAGGALVRKLMTAAHTLGTNTATLTATWTANGSDVLPVIVATWANFNATSAGSIQDEDVLNSTATLNVPGDSVTVTYTLSS